MAIKADMQRCTATFVSILYSETYEGESSIGGALLRPSRSSFLSDARATPPSPITLMEEFLIFAVDKDGKRPCFDVLSAGLASAILGELVLRGLVIITRRKGASSCVLNPGCEFGVEVHPFAKLPTGFPLLDEALDLIQHKADKGIMGWLRSLSKYHRKRGKHLATKCCERAIEQGVFDLKRRTFLRFFNSTRYHHTPGSEVWRVELYNLIRSFAYEGGNRPQSSRRYTLVALVLSVMQSKYVNFANIYTEEEKARAHESFINTFGKHGVYFFDHLT